MPDIFAEIAASAGDAEALLALCMRMAGAVDAEEKRKRAQREKKARQRAKLSPVVPGQEGTLGDIGGQTGTSDVPEPSNQRARYVGKQQEQEQEQKQEQGQEQELFPLAIARGTQKPAILARAAPASGSAGPKTTRKRTRQLGPPSHPPTPGAFLDHLHRVWTECAGMVEIPRFRKAIGACLRAGFTVGQIERAMRDWVGERERAKKPIVLEYLCAEMGSAVKSIDQGGVLFVFDPRDLGLEPAEARERQAVHLGALKARDEAFMQQLVQPPVPDVNFAEAANGT